MLLPDFYRRLRWNLFRMHYQFIMANDVQSPYDYLMLVAGPVPVEEWPKRRWELVNSFTSEGAFTGRAGPLPPNGAGAGGDLNASVLR